MLTFSKKSNYIVNGDNYEGVKEKMKPESIQAFRKTLHSQNYRPYRNKSSYRLLEKACAAGIAANDGAVWYVDFTDPLTNHLVDLFLGGKFLPHSGFRKQNALSESIKCGMQTIAKIQLRGLSAKQPESFHINNVYGILKENYNLSQGDTLNLNIKPRFEDLEEILRVIEQLGNKRFNKFGLFKTYIGECTKLEDLRRDLEFAKENGEYHKEQASSTIGGIYARTLGNTRVAYISLPNAISFIEPYIGGEPVISKNVSVPLRI
jgi:hypothetical protein